MKCKNCGEEKSKHLEGKRKYTGEEVLVCGSTIFESKQTTSFEISQSNETKK